MQGLNNACDGVEAEAGDEYGGGEREAGAEHSGLLVKAEAEVAGDRARAGAVVDGHHEDAEEEHGGDGAERVELRRCESVASAKSADADDVWRAEGCCHEGEAAKPGRERAAGFEEITGGLDRRTESEGDAQCERDVDEEDQDVGCGEAMHDLRLPD